MAFNFVQISARKYGKIKKNPQQVKQKLKQLIVKDLKQSEILNIKTLDDYISFKGQIFRFVWNGFNRYNPVSKGYFYIYNIENFLIVKYGLWFWEFFIIALIFSSIAFFGLFPNLIWRIIYFLTVWVIYLINVFLSAHRIGNNLKKLINSLEKNR